MRRLRPNTSCSSHKECARVAHRAVARRLNPLPAWRDGDPNGVRRNDPPTAAPYCKRDDCKAGEEDRNYAHLHVYESRTVSGPLPSPDFHIKPLGAEIPR